MLTGTISQISGHAASGPLAAVGAPWPRCGTVGSMSDLITKLVPILHVQDPDAERRFYEQLGLRTTYEAPNTRV